MNDSVGQNVRRFNTRDINEASIRYDQANGVGSFDKLTTRKRNRLSQDEMYHREHSDLCDALKGKFTKG